MANYPVIDWLLIGMLVNQVSFRFLKITKILSEFKILNWHSWFILRDDFMIPRNFEHVFEILSSWFVFMESSRNPNNFLVLSDEWMIKKKEMPVSGVMAFEILDEHFVDTLSVGWIAAAVTHRTSSAVEILPHDHRHLPNTRIRFSWTRWDHAVVEDLVVESVGPRRWRILVNGHRRVVRKVHVV